VERREGGEGRGLRGGDEAWEIPPPSSPSFPGPGQRPGPGPGPGRRRRRPSWPGKAAAREAGMGRKGGSAEGRSVTIAAAVSVTLTREGGSAIVPSERATADAAGGGGGEEWTGGRGMGGRSLGFLGRMAISRRRKSGTMGSSGDRSSFGGSSAPFERVG
jgi:hypothetical protein